MEYRTGHQNNNNNSNNNNHYHLYPDKSSKRKQIIQRISGEMKEEHRNRNLT